MSNEILKQIDSIYQQLIELRIAVKAEQAKDSSATARDPDYIPIMLTISQAVNKTGLSYDYLRKLCLQGRIVCIKSGSKYLINQEKLVDFLNGETAAGQVGK